MKIITVLFLSCVCVIHAQAQQKIRITIVDQNRNPVAGAGIKVYSSGKKDITNVKGEVLLVLNNTDSIAIRAANYLTKNAAVSTKTDQMSITLDALKPWEGSIELPWMSQNKKYSTAAVSTVSGAQLSKNPEPNSSNLLGGNLAGLVARQGSSEPGYDGAVFNIRGFSSYNSLSPLIYVDGIERDIQQIDPLELETVTILKDNAANGAFGIRGQGVPFWPPQKEDWPIPAKFLLWHKADCSIPELRRIFWAHSNTCSFITKAQLTMAFLQNIRKHRSMPITIRAETRCVIQT
ncbi:TonB-dependent receptor plug domain-containing protein [Pedobacter sp. HDW13]|nr:TonB-dependent receptor plug domain-containing protein [Pedobacter sp. HDW13]